MENLPKWDVPPGAAVASVELSTTARAVAQRYGLPRAARVCGVTRGAYLAVIARWPVRIATVEFVRARLTQLRERGYGSSTQLRKATNPEMAEDPS